MSAVAAFFKEDLLTKQLLILVKFWILNLMTKTNKPYDTTPRLDPSI